jgi:hypothetical protein
MLVTSLDAPSVTGAKTPARDFVVGLCKNHLWCRKCLILIMSEKNILNQIATTVRSQTMEEFIRANGASCQSTLWQPETLAAVKQRPVRRLWPFL